MRKPQRSIEVFDISLMAVVTKAMGAFLVLMILLMPYYSSGPIGQKATEDLSKKVNEADKNIKAAMNELGATNAEDLRKKLEDALKQLAEARMLLKEVQRANDALNAQVARLGEENKQLSSQLSQLQQQLSALNERVAQLENEKAELNKQLAMTRGPEISGQLANWDCPDVGFGLALDSLDTYHVIHNHRSKYVLNMGGLGRWNSASDADIVKLFPNQRAVQPGQQLRFNQSAFYYPAAPFGTYALVAFAYNTKTESRKEGGVQLKKPASDCRLLVSLQLTYNDNHEFLEQHTSSVVFSKDTYAMVVNDLVVSENQITAFDPSPDYLAWLKDQIKHADKEP